MAQILIVEDNEAVSETFEAALVDEGYSVTRVARANDAASAAALAMPDLVIMDLALQNSNGATASLALRGLGYKGPIILVTGGLIPLDPNVLDKISFAAELQKPVQLEELLATISRCLA